MSLFLVIIKGVIAVIIMVMIFLIIIKEQINCFQVVNFILVNKCSYVNHASMTIYVYDLGVLKIFIMSSRYFMRLFNDLVWDYSFGKISSSLFVIMMSYNYIKKAIKLYFKSV